MEHLTTELNLPMEPMVYQHVKLFDMLIKDTVTPTPAYLFGSAVSELTI